MGEDRDLIRIPRYEQERLRRFVAEISFQVWGLTQEPLGVEPENGKASEAAERS